MPMIIHDIPVHVLDVLFFCFWLPCSECSHSSLGPVVGVGVGVGSGAAFENSLTESVCLSFFVVYVVCLSLSKGYVPQQKKN